VLIFSISLNKEVAMKNLSLLFIAFIIIQPTTFAQEGWFEQTSGTTEYLVGVSFTDSDNGTVVGWNGTILRTTDGGTTWTLQTVTLQNLLDQNPFENKR